MDLQQVLSSLERADAAGDTQAAQELANLARSLMAGQTPQIQTPPAIIPQTGVIPSIKRSALGLQSLGGDIIPAMVGKFFGAEDYAKKQLEEAAQTQEYIKSKYPSEVPSYTDIKDVGTALTYIKESIGEAIPSMIPSLITGGAASLLAKPAQAAAIKAAETFAAEELAKAAAKNVISKEALDQIKQAAIQKGTQEAQKIGLQATAAGALTGSAAQNIPDVYQNIYEKTGQTDLGAALVAGGFNAALDAITPFRILSKFNKTGLTPQELIGAWYKRAGKGAAEGLLTEGATETLQEVSSAAAENFVAQNPDFFTKENFERFVNAGLKGAVGGAAITGATNVVAGRAEPKPEAKPEVTPDVTSKVTPEVKTETTPPVEPSTYKAAPSLTGMDAATLLEEQAKGTAGTDLLAASRAQQEEQERLQQEQAKAEAERQRLEQERARAMPGFLGSDLTNVQMLQAQREAQKKQEADAEKAQKAEIKKILATTYSADPLQNFRQQQAAIELIEGKKPQKKIEAPIKPTDLETLPDEVKPTAKPTDNTLAGQPTYTAGSVAEVPVANLKLSQDVPQFKSDANQAGVVESSKLEGKFDRRLASPIQVWQRANGDMEVISGRHRLDLAQRSGEKTIPAQIHKEADGFNADMARMLDIELNVKDGRGKVKDYVSFFKEFGLTKQQARDDGLLNTAIGRQAYEIADAGSPSLIAAHNNKDISDDAAAAIAINAPKDEALQNLGMQQVQNGKSINHAVNFMRSAMAAGFKGQEGSGDLFGFDDSFAKEAEAVTKEATKQQREARQQLSAIKGAAKSPEKARLGGVDVRNLEQTQAKIADLEKTISELENFHTNPELYKKLRQSAGLEEVLTAPTPEELRAKESRVKTEEKRIADEKKAAEDKAKADAEISEFGLTGSESPRDADANQGDMFSLRGKAAEQVSAFEQSLRTLLNKFGLKEIGLKLSEGMRDEGSYAAKLIQIAADSANPIRTLRHEAIHALRELGFFTDAQWNSLSKMAKDKWIDQYLKQRNIDGKPLKAGEESRYDAYMREYKGDMEKITEEAVADAFADFDATKAPAGMLQAILQKLRNLFQSIKTALTKVEAPEKIFGKVEKGELKPEAQRIATESKSLRDQATDNFKRWFGDSKVLDIDGSPLVMYTGTSKDVDFTKFKIPKNGAWFTSDAETASQYAKENDSKDIKYNPDTRKYEEVNTADRVMPVYLRIENPATLSKEDSDAMRYASNYRKVQGQIFDKLRAKGHDGVDMGDGVWVAIGQPTQIKSAIGNYGEYSLKDADIRKSLRTTPLQDGEQALDIIKSMGRTTEKPDESYKAKVQQAWNNAKDNPETTAKAVKDTLTRWSDQVQTWAFSSDAALNNSIRRAINETATTDAERTAFLLNTSLSQTVHADALASLFITEGNIKYNKDLHKWEAVKDKDNLVALVKGLEDISKKYNLSKEEAQLIGHTAFETKRLKSLVEFNDKVTQEVADMRKEAAQLRKEGKNRAADSLYEKATKRQKETKFIHMTDEEIASGNKLFDTIPELNNLVKTWNGIRSNAVKVLVETGLWSETDADFLLSNADYVPFFREDQLENGKGPKEFIRGLQVQAQEKKLKGSNKPVNDIFDNMVRWTQYSINRGVRNRSAVSLAEAAAEMGMARKVPVRAGNQNVVRIWKNGEEVLYSMADPMFIPAFTGLESVAIPSWKILSKFSNMLRQSVVMYPLFSISQVPQDSFAAIFTSGLKPQYALRIPVLAVKELIKTLVGKSKTHEELKKFGAVGVRDFTADMARVDAEVLAGLKMEKGLWSKVKGTLHHIAMASDNAVRQATYEAAMAQGLSQSEAIEKSFEVWNVRRKGSSQTLALAGQIIPFFNAYLAAQNVAFNVITGKGISPQKRADAYKTLAATTASVMTLSLLYTMMNGDDEDYENKPAVQRDRLLMIPGSGGMSIPLRSDLYTLPKIITEHAYLLMTDKGYEDGRKFRDSIKAALASSFLSPTTVPQAVKPLVEVGINYDFFTGRPIIGQFQKKLEVERQFNDSTAELAKALGSTGLVSPLNAEHLIRGMFGSVGGLILYATNPVLHSDPNVERPTLSAKEMLATLPGTSGFITRENQSALKNDFYVLRDEVAKVASTIADLKARSPEKLEEYLSSEEVIAKYGISKAVNKMVEQLGKIRKEMTRVTNATADVMTGEEKESTLKELRQVEKDMLKSINVKELRAAAGL